MTWYARCVSPAVLFLRAFGCLSSDDPLPPSIGPPLSSLLPSLAPSISAAAVPLITHIARKNHRVFTSVDERANERTNAHLVREPAVVLARLRLRLLGRRAEARVDAHS